MHMLSKKNNYKTDRCRNASCVIRQRHAWNMSTLHKHANTAGRSCTERWEMWRVMKHKMKRMMRRCHTFHTRKTKCT